MELTDIMPLRAREQFEKALSRRFGINATVCNTSGVSITGKPNWCNTVCPDIKGNQNALAAICAPGNQYFMARARKTRQTVIGECDAGLVKIAVPIFVDEAFLGTAGGCGLLPEGAQVEAFMVQQSLGMEAEEIIRRCRGLKTMSRQQARDMASYIENEIGRFVEAYQRRGISVGAQ